MVRSPPDLYRPGSQRATWGDQAATQADGHLKPHPKLVWHPGVSRTHSRQRGTNYGTNSGCRGWVRHSRLRLASVANDHDGVSQ